MDRRDALAVVFLLALIAATALAFTYGADIMQFFGL